MAEQATAASGPTQAWQVLRRSQPRRPHPALARLVTSVQPYDYTGAVGTVHHGLPSTSLTVVLAMERPIEVAPLGTPAGQAFWSTIGGLTTRPVAITNSGRHIGIQISLDPSATRPLFGMPATELAGQLVSAEDVLGRDGLRLYDDVVAEAGWAARLAVLERHLVRLASRPEAEGRTAADLRWAWLELSRRHGDVRVQWLADRIGWSRRHFTQRFRAEFGLGPKEAARVARFELSRRLLSRPGAIADVAHAGGYADQAHLTREWQELAGLTPGQWRRQELPFLQGIDEVA